MVKCMGIDLIDMGWVILAIAASLVASRVVNLLLTEYVKRLTEKTATTLDDRMLEAIRKPVTAAIILLGTYLALSSLPSFLQFSQPITTGASILGIAVVAYAALRVVDAFLAWYADERAPKNEAMTDLIVVFRRIATAAIIVISAITALSELGVEVTPLIASMGIAGLAVALAFQDTLANFFSGIYLTVDRPIRSGDYIQLEGGYEGHVQKIGWRSTQIRTLANNLVVVPNSKVASSVITNYYAPDKSMGVVIPVSVSYDTDLTRAEKVTIEVAKNVQKMVKGADVKFQPFVRYNSFGDSGIGFSVILRVNEYVDKYLITHEFIKALHKRFMKEKIEIPYPKRDVYLKDGAWKRPRKRS